MSLELKLACLDFGMLMDSAADVKSFEPSSPVTDDTKYVRRL